MSDGSKPAITTGFSWSRAMNSNGRKPMIVLTCPGPMKPSSRMSGESRIALIAGTMVTWLQKTEKLSSPSSRARNSVAAVDGAVVSKPTAKKTTCRSRDSRAIRKASSGE